MKFDLEKRTKVVHENVSFVFDEVKGNFGKIRFLLKRYKKGHALVMKICVYIMLSFIKI